MPLAASIECPDENQFLEGPGGDFGIDLARNRACTEHISDNCSTGSFTGPGISPRYSSWRRDAQLAGRCQTFRVGLRLDSAVWDCVILGRE